MKTENKGSPMPEPRPPGQSKEYLEQLAIMAIAKSRFPDATGVKEIQPFLMTNEKVDNWAVTLITKEAFSYKLTLVTGEDIRQFQQGQEKKNNPKM